MIESKWAGKTEDLEISLLVPGYLAVWGYPVDIEENSVKSNETDEVFFSANLCSTSPFIRLLPAPPKNKTTLKKAIKQQNSLILQPTLAFLV